MATVYMTGNTHFDPVWLWRWDEAMASIRATFRSVLERMEEDGVIVRRVDGARAKATYRYCGDSTVRNMRSIFCQVCGKNVALPLELATKFEGTISEKTGFAITDHQILLYGICPDCRSVE